MFVKYAKTKYFKITKCQIVIANDKYLYETQCLIFNLLLFILNHMSDKRALNKTSINDSTYTKESRKCNLFNLEKNIILHSTEPNILNKRGDLLV